MQVQRINTPGQEEFLSTATDWLAGHIVAAIAERGRALIALSGGSTPGPVYRALSTRSEIDWIRVRVLLMDERCVPPVHDESNQRLIRETLLEPAGIPVELCVFPDTALSPDACAAQLEDQVRAALADGPIDVAVFGMGTDGHTASLFPPLSETAFGPGLAVHTVTDTFAVHDRVSLTVPPLAEARAKLLLLTGAEKLHVFEEMIQAPQDPRRWPLQEILERDAMVLTRL